jgi:hypothetical protein
MFEAKIRSTVRYADPSCWITAAAVALAIKDSGIALDECCHEIGVVTVSDDGPRASMAEVEALGTTGFSSPLRYAASSPGAIVGVSCIAFGLRGPTLNFTMAPSDGVPMALAMCQGWISRSVARFMVLATYQDGSEGSALSRAVVLGPSAAGNTTTTVPIEWLTGKW